MNTLSQQRKQLRQLVGTGAAHGVNIAMSELSEEGFEKLLENGDELRAAVIQTITTKARELSLSNQFAGEEVASNYGYLSGYTKPKGVMRQTNELRRLFPAVNASNARHDEKLAQMVVPAGAEGLFVIPRWQSMAPTYGEAVQIVLAKLNETRKFINYRKNEMTPANLRESDRKAEVMASIAESQKGYDLLVVSAQFGLVHRGRSVRRARVVIGNKGFGLGAFEVGSMLLTHPERLQNYNDLWIDCAGDELKPSDEREFSCAPFFRFGGDGLDFDAFWVDIEHDIYGSASGFLPQ